MPLTLNVIIHCTISTTTVADGTMAGYENTYDCGDVEDRTHRCQVWTFYAIHIPDISLVDPIWGSISRVGQSHAKTLGSHFIE